MGRLMPMSARALLLALAFASGACATTTSTPATTMTTASEFAPTPYTAEQIRDATKLGRIYEWRVERAGQPPKTHTATFTMVAADRAEMTLADLDEQGQPLGPTKSATQTWAELRDHAQFPRAATRISEEAVTLPAGSFDCLRYDVTGTDGAVTRFYFAKTLPGAPVLYFTEKDGARLMTSTLVRHEAGK